MDEARVRIVSKDGIGLGTEVHDAGTGAPLPSIRVTGISIPSPDSPVRAYLEVLVDEVDVVAMAHLSPRAAALTLIALERHRQVQGEGYDEAHDDQVNGSGELARAAACYAMPEARRPNDSLDNAPSLWPWSAIHWKPSADDRERELVKAAALIVAELERLRRAKAARG